MSTTSRALFSAAAQYLGSTHRSNNKTAHTQCLFFSNIFIIVRLSTSLRCFSSVMLAQFGWNGMTHGHAATDGCVIRVDCNMRR
jgi:hypothetical protein